MTRKGREQAKIVFTTEEVLFTLIGAIAIVFGAISSSAGRGGLLLGIALTWFGLLLFMLPLIKKVEALMK